MYGNTDRFLIGFPKSANGMRTQSVCFHPCALEKANNEAGPMRALVPEAGELGGTVKEITAIYAASGHKAVATAIPLPKTYYDSPFLELKVEPKGFRDADGRRITGKELCIRSVLMLPLRQLLLLGCNDAIHACV